MKKKTCKLIALAFAVLFCLTLLPACGKDTANTKVTTKVTLNEVAHSIFYAPMYVAIENGYFAEEGIDLTLVTGFGADKTMTALLTGEADIGFMGSESTIYTYVGGNEDYAVNFAQLTQRAGNFVVSRTPIDNFSFDMLIGKNVLGGRPGGMPEMVFEYILLKTILTRHRTFPLTRASTSAPRLLPFPAVRAISPLNLNPMPRHWRKKAMASWLPLWAKLPVMCHTQLFLLKRAI